MKNLKILILGLEHIGLPQKQVRQEGKLGLSLQAEHWPKDAEYIGVERDM